MSKSNIQQLLLMQGGNIRIAKHAGSWYEKNKEILTKTIDKFLQTAECVVKNWKHIKAIIGPHAGYAYSGPTAAWAYKYFLDQQLRSKYKRIFLLGPSHKKYFQGCCLSKMDELQTPLGNLRVDSEQIKLLESKGRFVKMTKRDEENEHSLQMHMPYIFRLFGNKAKVVPIIVGQNNEKLLQEYGKLFSPYFQQQDTLFIISSDFCHWGQHFDFQPYKQGQQPWKFIQRLDKQGMNLIEKHDLKSFSAYLQKTSNTICGEQPIKLLLSIIRQSKIGVNTTFVKYSQSEQVKSFDDSSVSYASSVTFLVE